MRKKYTVYNSLAGLINKIIAMVFVFIVRWFFTRYLNVQYLGIEGLFANVLGVFSLVDLGFGNAIAFNLYTPIHNDDHNTVQSIMNFYKKVYIVIGIFIFILSVCFVPFIVFFVKGATLSDGIIRINFLLYALSVSVSYFFAYKRTLIFALQRNYIVLTVDSITKIVLSVCQIWLIIVWNSYSYYLISTIVINLFGNIAISEILKRIYPNDKTQELKLSTEFKGKIIEHIKTLAITNISWVGISSTDNIIISSMIGVIELAKNANYSTLSASINSIVSTVLGGASASIGDLISENDKSRMYKNFQRYIFIYIIVSGYASLGMFFCSKALVSVWVGSNLVLNDFAVGLISINLFLILIYKPLADYLNYSGCFVYYKIKSVISLFINITISIIAGYFIGLGGVFLGTTITYIYMIYTVSKILYCKIFEEKHLLFLKKILKYAFPILISMIPMLFLREIGFGNMYISFVLNIVFVSVIYCMAVIVILFNEDSFLFFKEYFIQVMRKISKKRG